MTDATGANAATVLVVNDDEVGRYATSRMLRQAGFRTLEAGTGEQALERAALRPDLVLLDVNLPDIDGFEVCRRLKADPGTRRIPVLHLSASYLDADSQVRGLESGADGYLTYPLEPPVLVATIRAHMRIRQVEAEKKELAVLLEDVSDAVVTADSTGRILSWNRGAELIYGWSAREVLGRSLDDLLQPDYLGESEEDVWRTLRARGRWAGQALHRGAGTTVVVQSSLTLAQSEGGRPARLVLLSRDITRQKRMEREREELLRELGALNRDLERRVEERTGELTEANAALEARTDELEALAYAISHDLRAPLRGVDGFSRVVLEDYGDQLDEEGRNYLRRVCAGAQRMGELIDHLLDLSRLSRRDMSFEEVDLSRAAREIAEGLRRGDPERSVEFAIQEGVVVQGDRALLRMALKHLLENAFKFTAREPEAVIEFGTAELRHARAYFVKDNGIGFDTRYANRLFTAFQRLHPSEEAQGPGIGLATVRRIVHRHGGQIWAEAEPGEGARFFFTLLSPPAERDSEAREERSGPTR